MAAKMAEIRKTRFLIQILSKCDICFIVNNGYGKSDFDVQIMIGAHLKWKIKFKIYFTVYVREWKSDFYLLVSHGLSLYIVYNPMMTYNNKV